MVSQNIKYYMGKSSEDLWTVDVSSPPGQIIVKHKQEAAGQSCGELLDSHCSVVAQ